MFKRFGLGFAAGYVVGARGGEKHFERLTDMTRRVGELPAVRRLSEEGVDGIRERIQALVDQVTHRDDDESDSDQSERASRRGKTDGENEDVGGQDEDSEEDDFDDRVDNDEFEEDDAEAPEEESDRNDQVTAEEDDGETDAGEPAPSGGQGRHRRPRREARANGGSHRSDRSSRQDDSKQNSGGSRRHGVAGFASTLLERGRVD